MLTRFSHYKSMGIFFRRSRAANSVVLGRIWLKFELVRDIMVVLVTASMKKIQIKNWVGECRDVTPTKLQSQMKKETISNAY